MSPGPRLIRRIAALHQAVLSATYRRSLIGKPNFCLALLRILTKALRAVASK